MYLRIGTLSITTDESNHRYRSMYGYGGSMSVRSTDEPGLADELASTYAEWFATLSDPTRVRLLHAVSTAPAGHLRVGDLATELGISQSTASHHVRRP